MRFPADLIFPCLFLVRATSSSLVDSSFPWDRIDLADLHTVRDFIRLGMSALAVSKVVCGHGFATIRDEVRYLVLNTLHLPYEDGEDFADACLLSDEKLLIMERLRQRGEQRIPLAYITGEAFLAGYHFRIDDRVIVPRSLLAQFIMDDEFPPAWWGELSRDGEMPEAHPERILDLCTGSGCLAILLAMAFPSAMIDAVDISAGALEVASQNVLDYQLEDRISCIQSNLFQNLQGRQYDWIVCNPPYVSEPRMRALPTEYQHEPRLALAGGEDGLEIIRTCLDEAPDYLSERGLFLLEAGHNQESLEHAYPDYPFVWLPTDTDENIVCCLRRSDWKQA